MTSVPRKKITKNDLTFDYSNSSNQVKGQMELPFKPTLTVEEVRAIIEEARESIIQTICDSVERMIEDANNR